MSIHTPDATPSPYSQRKVCFQICSEGCCGIYNIVKVLWNIQYSENCCGTYITVKVVVGHTVYCRLLYGIQYSEGCFGTYSKVKAVVGHTV